MTDHLRKPRLLQMMLSTQPGGAETFFEKLALAFAGFEIPQCLVMEPNAEREALFASYSHVEVVPIRFGGLREWPARERLKCAFEGFSPDVALTWMNRASRRVPRGFCPVVGRLGGYYKLKHYTKCDHLVGITPDLVDHILASGRSDTAVSMIPNFGETPQMSEPEAGQELLRSLKVPSEHTVLLALGRLHEVKAHDTLLAAMARVPDTSLLLAGEGPLQELLQRQAKELGLMERVHFLGWRRDVATLFDACDISIFPSRYEPNGTVVMESWAHGKPLIASRAKGPNWLVDDGRDGLLFNIDDVDALAEKIGQVKENPQLAESLVQCGREKWLRAFSREAVVGRYLELFEQLKNR
jgi:glycosyltransferase involved in cell wall biosynthesis